MVALVKSPSKEQVREYMKARAVAHSAPPALQDIRRRLGWHLVEAECAAKAKR